MSKTTVIEEDSVSSQHESTECGFCGSSTQNEETVVVGGGIGSRHRDVQEWHRECADSMFDIPDSAIDYHVETLREYVTVETVAAFLLGVMLMLLISSFMVV